jgi:hypothetical protein
MLGTLATTMGQFGLLAIPVLVVTQLLSGRAARFGSTTETAVALVALLIRPRLGKECFFGCCANCDADGMTVRKVRQSLVGA